ncbi:cytochrome c peroxidase [Bisbaumannia pacifica]|uniref:Cytochrome c domain-containing protein n=1 Tax=Bisbaumannia pacifica TaxID=77098 RepID=A0ABD4KYS6_9GAMM|nr:cytochrome c peroxidase [Halomonas pacifica]MBH8579478.1 hypothetical protein [Halomonas pacifica]
MTHAFPPSRFTKWQCTLAGTLLSLSLAGVAVQAAADGMDNPCAAISTSAAANPCAADDPAQAVKRPEGYTPAYSESGENDAELLARGEALFNDTSLSGNGLSCASCHGGDQGYQATFEQPYPHRVAMGENMFGMETVHADEMVQMCMVTPMAAEALGWDSEELAALSAYVVEVQRRYSGQSHNL